MKYLSQEGLERLVKNIARAVKNGKWMPVRQGQGEESVVVGGKE